ncbi:hypothetical protein BHM03_00059340, partial [Ensete ventricosum]
AGGWTEGVEALFLSPPPGERREPEGVMGNCLCFEDRSRRLQFRSISPGTGGTYRSARLPVRGPPATGRFRQKSAVDDRLSEKSTVGGRLSEKSTVDGRLRNKKEEEEEKKKKEEGKKEYHASAVLAHLSSLPAGRLRAVARGRNRFFSRLRRQIEATNVVTLPVTIKDVEDFRQMPGYGNVQIFTYDELRLATNNFCPDLILGEGGFGLVYKEASQFIGFFLLCQAEVNYLGLFSHPNLVKLIGYCCEGEHRLLVYEYMANGSLENHLFISMMMNIHALRHHFCYFGLAKEGPMGEQTHVSTRVMGTYGYAAPEYILTGHLTARSDVYGFGVVLLELLLGRTALDQSRPSREHNLVDWARPLLVRPNKLFRIIDPRMDGQYSEEKAERVARLAFDCLSENPKARPSMNEAVDVLRDVLKAADDISLPLPTPEATAGMTPTTIPPLQFER